MTLASTVHAIMSQKRKHSPDQRGGDSVFRSASVEDRTSTFIGYFSPGMKPTELQNLEEFASASHKMLAWRRESNQQAITGGAKFTTGSDDDGEKYGGKKVEKVLESMQVTGTCVVARWYGGVLLGPVRFTHIESCAREAIRTWQNSIAEQQTKKRKEDEHEAVRSRLTKVLLERDSSIIVLRALAIEKELAARQIAGDLEQKTSADEGETKDRSCQQSVTPTKPSIDYDTMPVDKLRTLEKARDATLSFLLKRIDKAEADLKSLDQ